MLLNFFDDAASIYHRDRWTVPQIVDSASSVEIQQTRFVDTTICNKDTRSHSVGTTICNKDMRSHSVDTSDLHHLMAVICCRAIHPENAAAASRPLRKAGAGS